MIKKLLFALLLLTVYLRTYSQDRTVEFKNGHKIDYTVVSKSPDDIHPFTIFGGF